MKKIVLYKKEAGTETLLDRFDDEESASNAVRDILEDNDEESVFNFFIQEEEYNEITDRVKTYGDACAILGITPMNEANMKAQGFRRDEIARRKLETITEALNEGWKPDWNNTNQYKYYPWFCIEPNSSGANAGLSYAGTSSAATNTYAIIGSRLCFREARLARHAGRTFTDLYEQILIEKL